MSFEHYLVPIKKSELLYAAQQTQLQIEQFVQSTSKPNLMLSGPPGSGKTTIARVLLTECVTRHCGTNPSVYTIHAKNFKSANVIDNLFDIQLWTVGFGFCVIEEFDKLSVAQMLDVRALLDERKGVAGIIGTTNYLSQIDAAMRSRFKCLEIKCPAASSFLPLAQQYLKSKNISLSDSKVLAVLNAAGSDIRAMQIAVDDLVFAQQNPILFKRLKATK